MTSKAELATNKPSITQLQQVASGELITAEVENANNLLNLNAIILAYNWIVANGADLSLENIFTTAQQFSAGIKANSIESLTTNANIIINNGTGKVYKNSVASGQEFQTLAEVNTLISTLTGTAFTLLNGGTKATDFTVVSGTYYYVSGASGDVVATLPVSPSTGDVVGFVNYLQNFQSNGNVFQIVSTSHNVQGAASTVSNPETLNYFYTLYLIYDATLGWYRL